MPDDPNKKRPQDASRINIHQDWELTYWSKTLGVTKEQLVKLVRQYGDSVAVIRGKIK